MKPPSLDFLMSMNFTMFGWFNCRWMLASWKISLWETLIYAMRYMSNHLMATFSPDRTWLPRNTSPYAPFPRRCFVITY